MGWVPCVCAGRNPTGIEWVSFVLQALLYALIFLIEVAVFARVQSRTVRQASLLIASYVLYLSWQPWFAAVLAASTLVNYGIGRWLRRDGRTFVLWLGILFNLALLSSFKYLPEVAVQLPFASLQKFAYLALPLGISFWTFQAMSYLFDLYRGEQLDPSLVEFALFMAFFPVTISGPVCRMPEMLPQLRSEKRAGWSDRQSGLGRIATGVLMMQLAKLLGQGILAGDGINSGFDQLTHWSGADVWCLTLGYGLQLFFDFAGYSHIAIGGAQVLGFNIPENFARPFESDSPSAFWTRWHMSLSFWIRDYVFLPLAMIRREMWWRTLVLVFSMILFGLWHKVTLLFLIWGCYHGVLLVLHRQVQQLERRFDWQPAGRLWNVFSWMVTMLLISLGWIFFRANTLTEARQMLAAAASSGDYFSHALSGSLYLLVALLAASYTLVLITAEFFRRYSTESEVAPRPEILAVLTRRRWYWVPALYAIVLLGVLLITLTQGATTAQFMYRSF